MMRSDKITVGSLFSGIGGIELGLERTGRFETIWQVEINEFCRKVLKEKWPSVVCREDVFNETSKTLESVDLICGGVPCQPTSQAAARSTRGEGWLWPEMFRLVKEMKPRYVVIENPESLRYQGRGLGRILSDLASIRYDAEWGVVRASDVGAPHKRARIWVVAYPDSDGEPNIPIYDEASFLSELGKTFREWPDPPGDVGMDDGISDRVDRVRALGNAVVPQVAEVVGRLIMRRDDALR